MSQSLNRNEQEFVERNRQSERIPVTDDSQLAPKSRPKFYAGFNAGQAVEGGLRRPDHELLNRTLDFQIGYVYGVIERRNGNIHDDLSCTNRINFCWELYRADALPPKDTRLP